MNIKGLRAFSEIMACGTLSEAARNLNVSATALSRQLMEIEAELRLQLFERKKQRLVPTAEGEAFYPEAQRVLASIEQVPEIVREIKRGSRQRLRMVVMPRLSEGIAMPALKVFLDRQPGVDVLVELQIWRYMERWIASRGFEIGLGALPARHGSIVTERIGRIPLVVVLHPNHPWVSREEILVDDLASEALITMPLSTHIGFQTSRILADADVEPKSRVQISQSQSCCCLVAEGGGIAISDVLTANRFGSRVRMVPLRSVGGVDFGLLFPRGVERSKPSLLLADLIRQRSHAMLESWNDMNFRATCESR